MTRLSGDIDIDTPTSFDPGVFGWTRSMIVDGGKVRPHPCGYYPQAIPIDPITKLAAIPYDVAEGLEYIKIDFLHLSVYDRFYSRADIERLVNTEPDWGILLVPSHQRKLFQLAKHGELLTLLMPRSIIELSDVLALIRPGKKDLIKPYRAHPEKIRPLLYAKDDKGYAFKKSHSIAYALVVVLQLHLIESELL